MVAAKQSSFTILFEEPVEGVSLAYDGKERISSKEHEEALEQSYRKGYDDASVQLNQQILEFRSEVNEMRVGTFSMLEEKFLGVVKEAREALIALTYDCVCRTLGSFEMNAEVVSAIVDGIVEESGLSEESMDVYLHPDDLALLEDLQEDIRDRHPGLTLVADANLSRGDCKLSSRFGKVDGLLSTKLDRLKENLCPEE